MDLCEFWDVFGDDVLVLEDCGWDVDSCLSSNLFAPETLVFFGTENGFVFFGMGL